MTAFKNQNDTYFFFRRFLTVDTDSVPFPPLNSAQVDMTHINRETMVFWQGSLPHLILWCVVMYCHVVTYCSVLVLCDAVIGNGDTGIYFCEVV